MTVKDMYCSCNKGDKMTKDSAMHIEISGNDTLFTRIIDAPRDLVWKAWTDPKHLAKWWGPHVMTNPVCEVDLRPGGTFRIVMRDPKGIDYPITGVYVEIVVPERIVSTVNTEEHSKEWHDMINRNRPGGGKAATEMRWTVTFKKVPGDGTGMVSFLEKGGFGLFQVPCEFVLLEYGMADHIRRQSEQRVQIGGQDLSGDRREIPSGRSLEIASRSVNGAEDRKGVARFGPAVQE